MESTTVGLKTVGETTLRGKARRDQSLEELREHIHRYYIPLGRQYMVLFPEGGFLHKRKEVSQRFAEKNNLPKLEYVSLPRADKNFNQNNERLLEVKSGNSVEWILDVTIAYPDRIPLHLTDIVCGIRPACTTHVHYRLYPSSEVPSDTEGMTQWLYDRFIEKEKILEEFYRTGQFPSKSNTPLVFRPVRQDNVRYLILHLFFIASTFIQIKFFCSLLGCFW
ncbi:unnamed protein product [Leptidea sinapis]|uniref:Acyltransferase C-terminal domain-containing protein n=1 Tax=Leptidea sinapis TaxID=189913 RepID=A0A5E4QF89_9NEOP|nr:unnamed protein product [Leptidea sinapis]